MCIRDRIYFVGTLQGNTILNAGSSTIQGVELEMTAVPVDGLTLTGSLAYLKAEYDKFIYTTSNYAPPGQVRVLDMHGEPLQNAPEWTASVGAEYVFPVAGGDGRINLQYTYQDEKLLSSIEDVPRARIQSMQYLNGNIDWKPASGAFTIGVWGRNILDKRYINSVLDLPGTLGLTQYAPPREYGLSFSYNF